MIDLIREYKEYAITTAVALIVGVLIALSRGIFQEDEIDMIITIISDAFLYLVYYWFVLDLSFMLPMKGCF